MTNEEAKLTIEYLKEMQEEYIEGEGYERHPLPEWYALDIAIKAIEQTTWIPVSEKMPPIAQRVLVSANNGEVFIARFHSINKWTFEPTGIGYAYDKDNVIAWMPLPSYQGE